MPRRFGPRRVRGRILVPPEGAQSEERTLTSLVRSIYLESEIGVPTDLDAAGTTLENPYVYDSAARDLKAMADEGLVKIVREQVRHGLPDRLIGHISFARLR